jgi:cell division protein YceG involved in septum cleavage
MKSKKLITLIFTLFIIAMAVALFAILNAVDVKEKYDSQKNASVTIVKGDKSAVFDLVYLQQFEKVVFVARQDTSKTNAEEKVFSGVPLITVLEAKGLSLDGTKEVV